MLLTRLEIENFRGIQSLDLYLGETTVLIGENNTGKTTVLHALRLCLQQLRASGRSAVFDDFDFHFLDANSDPASAQPICITLTFEERPPEEWHAEIERQLGGDSNVVMVLSPDDHLRVKLRVTAEFSSVTQDIETSFDFLDANDKPLAGKSRSRLAILQQLRPLFYLSALRDAGKEFSRTAQYWAPFVKHSQIGQEKKSEIEAQLQAINAEIIEAHGTFKGVREHLSKVQNLVSLGRDDVVSVDAVPARIFDMLNRAQVSIASATGARLPIGRHGEGTQSLTVLMLFDAFLSSELGRKQSVKESQPIVALEEPEAHLHPSAVRALWKTLKNIKGQKLIATHSGDLLSEVDVGQIRRLYRRGAKIMAGSLPEDLLRTRERLKFDYLVRRTRGELFFARCWLLGEGETEAILFAGAAEVLGVDLEQAGVRCIEYRQGDIAFFLDAANSLGISWSCLLDGDGQGATDVAKAKKRVPAGSRDRWHVTMLPDGNSIEPYLANNGFLDIFEKMASAQLLKNLTVDKSEPTYPAAVVGCLGKDGKIGAAHAVVAKMREVGKSSVPMELRRAVYKAAALGRRG